MSDETVCTIDDKCLGEIFALSERNLWIDNHENTEVILNYIRKGCYSCDYEFKKSCRDYNKYVMDNS